MHGKTPKLMARSSLSALFDSRRRDFVSRKQSLNIAMIYLAVFLFGGLASSNMQTRLISMLLLALVVDGVVILGLELPNKKQALRL